MHPEASAFLYNKKKLIIFANINISILIEKKIHNIKVPFRCHRKNQWETVFGNRLEIEMAKIQELSDNDKVLNRQ